MKKISVIVPVYNAENTLKKCVDSICKQTYRNLEIILVDDGSADSSLQICEALAKEDKRIKVVHKENGGPSEARNAGLKCATGEYVAFVDSDDYLDQDYYSSIIDENDYDLYVAGYKMIYVDNIKEVRVEAKLFENSNVEFFNESYISRCFNSPCNKLYKRSRLNGISFDKEFKFGEDYKFNLEFIKNTSRIKTVDSVGYNYIMSGNVNSITKTETSSRKLESFAMQIEMAENLCSPLDSRVAYVLLEGIFSVVREQIKKGTESKRDKIEFIKQAKAKAKSLIKISKAKGLKQNIIKTVMKMKASMIYLFCKTV